MSSKNLKFLVNQKSYPPEYIFSEKYEAMLYLGEVNGRMKDFDDCCRLVVEEKLDKALTKKAFEEAVQNRETTFNLISEPAQTN